MRNSAQCSLVNTHKMHPVYQPSRPKNQIPKKSKVSRAKSLPSQQSLRREKRRVFDIYRGFDRRGKKTRRTKPKCDQGATSQHFHGFLARGHAGPRDCKKAFSWREQLVARCNPDFSRVKEIRKTKASIREKELGSRGKSQKAPASLCCAPESRLETPSQY